MKTIFLLLAIFLLPSCGLRITEDGCILGSYKKGSSTYYAGPCLGPDKDGDGDSDIDRFRVQWANDDGQQLRATYWLKNKPLVMEYQLQDGLWVGWSSKSGVTIYPIPPEVEKAMEGKPEPIEEPKPSLAPPIPDAVPVAFRSYLYHGRPRLFIV